MFETLWDEPANSRGWMIVADNGRVKLRGMEHGVMTLINMRRSEALGGYVAVLHEKGGKHWAGRGMKAQSHGASVRTVLIEGLDTSPERLSRIASYRYVELTGMSYVPANDTERAERSAIYAEKMRADEEDAK